MIISLLIAVVVMCVVWWAVSYLASVFGLPEQLKAVILVVFVILVILWLVGRFGGSSNLNFL